MSKPSIEALAARLDVQGQPACRPQRPQSEDRRNDQDQGVEERSIFAILVAEGEALVTDDTRLIRNLRSRRPAPGQ